MNRERALKVVLVVVGMIFCALAYPLIMFVKQEPALAGQAFAGLIARGELIGSAVLVVIGIALLVLAPAEQGVERPSSVAA